MCIRDRTSGAADKLSDAGIETETLQAHLARGQRPDTGELRLYVMDESSLASTKQMHEFVSRLHPNDRVSVSYTHLDVYKRQGADVPRAGVRFE